MGYSFSAKAKVTVLQLITAVLYSGFVYAQTLLINRLGTTGTIRYDLFLLPVLLLILYIAASLAEQFIREQTYANYAAGLSGGEKKRVACARALYKECEILVLDELSSSISREMALEIERFLLLDSGRTILHVTHTLDKETAALYDGIFLVADGRVTSISAEEL